MIRPKSLFVSTLLPAALMLGGCSTWRCRGFIDSMDRPQEPPREKYVIESIEFRNMAVGDVESREKSPMLAWLSEQNGLVGTSYIEDIAKATGLTNDAPDAIKVCISVVPILESKTGKSSIAWPLCGTLGVFPCHFVEEVPFDVIVRFDKPVANRPDLPAHSYARALVGQIRVDSQYGLSRMDMDAPPPARSAVGELRDDGTIGTGRELRMERFRTVFVQTVSTIVLNLIASCEETGKVRVDAATTEFGQIAFPSFNLSERENTLGWNNDPQPTVLPIETLAAYLDRVWSHPVTIEEVRFKKMVDDGLISKDEWKRQMSDLWRRKNEAGKKQ